MNTIENNRDALPEKSARGCGPLGFMSLLVLSCLLLTALAPAIAGRLLIVSDRLETADAIAILSGGTDNARLKYAASLYTDQKADWVIITDTGLELPDGSFTVRDYVVSRMGRFGVPSENILTAEGNVDSTVEEAISIRNLVQQHGMQSLIVVTDPYHTLRARFIFRHIFHGTGIKVMVCPVAESWYKPYTWWRTEKGRDVTVNEYIKLIGYFLGIGR